MHHTLKYCVYEKKKIRRLDHSIHLITQFFEDLHTDYTLYLEKPKATPRTSKIFKNHLKSEAEMKNFKVEKGSSGFTITEITKNTEYHIILAVPTAHECYLACSYCGFCVHTFRCSCNNNKFHGDFCVHLHFLSTFRNLLPSFELPINAQISFFQNAGKYSTALSSTVSSSTVLASTAPPPAVLQQAEPTNYVAEFDGINSMDSISRLEGNLSGYQDNFDTGCDLDCSMDFQLSDSTNEEQFGHVVQNLSSVHAKIGTYITKLKNRNQVPTEKDISAVNEIYLEWCKQLPNFSTMCGAIELSDCKSSSQQKKLNEADKQIRLFSNPKKPGRKKSKKVLKKPDSPEKRKLEKELIEGVAPKKKNMKADFQKAQTVTKETNKSAKKPTRQSTRQSATKSKANSKSK